MISIQKTNSNNPDFQKLTVLFYDFLIDIDGEENDFFAQFNQIYLDNVVICYENAVPVGCGTFKNMNSRK